MSADLASHREESATIARAESLSELLAGLRGDLVTLEEYAYTRLKEANSNLVELQAKHRVAASRNVFLKDWCEIVEDNAHSVVRRLEHDNYRLAECMFFLKQRLEFCENQFNQDEWSLVKHKLDEMNKLIRQSAAFSDIRHLETFPPSEAGIQDGSLHVHHLREQQLERLTQSLDVAQHALDKHVRKSALLQQNNEKLQSQLDSCQNALAAENREKKELQRQVKSLQTAAQYHEWMHRKAQKDLVHKVNENDRAALSTLISTGELTLDFLVSLRSETQSLVDLIVQCFTPNTSSDK